MVTRFWRSIAEILLSSWHINDSVAHDCLGMPRSSRSCSCYTVVHPGKDRDSLDIAMSDLQCAACMQAWSTVV